MGMGKRVAFEKLISADLVVDAVYEGGKKGNASDDPLSKLLPVGLQGGFRIRGSGKSHDYRLVVLYTSGSNPDWPDRLDVNSGRFTYYGDNKKPGSELHATGPGGNELLRFVFECIHASPTSRHQVPPFFVFEKHQRGPGRDVRFVGLAVPGGADINPLDDLVAVWRSTKGERFQNYKSEFTILNVASVAREWIDELASGEKLGVHCPPAYRTWVESGKYTPLESPSTLPYRTSAEQKPDTAQGVQIVEAIYQYFKPDPYAFEALAIELWKLSVAEEVSVEATRRSRDSGRDAFGKMFVGPPGAKIPLDFSLEAKCFEPSKGCGVGATSRLISRLRNRHFGVFVTTSYVGPDPSREIYEDRQPIVVIAGRDIAQLLVDDGLSTAAQVVDWLKANFPLQATDS
jgi:hypothetical protein